MMADLLFHGRQVVRVEAAAIALHVAKALELSLDRAHGPEMRPLEVPGLGPSLCLEFGLNASLNDAAPEKNLQRIKRHGFLRELLSQCALVIMQRGRANSKATPEEALAKYTQNQGPDLSKMKSVPSALIFGLYPEEPQ